MSIRKKVSDILGYSVPPLKYHERFKELETLGIITAKHQNEILAELCRREEEREKQDKDNIQSIE